MSSSFIQLDQLAPQVKPGVKIIKSSDYVQFKTAKELWYTTQEETKKNKAEAEQLKLKSIEAGLSKGAEEAKSRMASQILNSATSLMSQLNEIEKDLSEVVMSAVRKIISDFDDEQLVLEAVKKGLQPVYNSKKVAIRVSPESVPFITSQLDNLKHEIDFLEILPDMKLGAKDCIIESDIGIVDASIDSQLQAIEKAVKTKALGSLKNERPQSPQQQS